MSWNRLGRVFEPPRTYKWWQTHAQLPVAHQISGDRYRIYVGARNGHNRTQIGSVDIDLTDPSEPLAVSHSPLVTLGELGTFDDSGVYPSSVVDTGDEVYLYYIGWMDGKRVSYYASVGLAVSKDGGESFEKYSQGPHLARNNIDPYMTLASCVRQYDEMWHMWYTSATKWEQCENKTRPNYHIKYASSENGIDWTRDGTVCIDYEHDEEWAIACPAIVRTDGTYRMWYAHVIGDGNYQIGYAESDDGINWIRKDDQAGITTGSDGWDSDMQAYPNVIEHDGELYLLYNGNNYGHDGFGIAKWS